MKRILFILLLYTLIVLGIPLLSVLMLRRIPSATPAEPLSSVTVYIADEDRVEEMDFSAYLKGVVAAEMPASFHPESLRAQAIAARSYILRRREGYLKSGIPEAHKGAYVCTNPSHCNAWKSEDALQAQWGTDFDANMQKIAESVDATASMVLTYNGEVANTVYHSTSSGKTENASDVWGGEVAYLTSVQSYGDSLSPRFCSTLTLSVKEYVDKLKAAYPDANLSAGQAPIGEVLRSEAGGIKKITTCGITLTGTEFRALYTLSSTNVQFTQSDSSVTMTVTGNGHGVGMSQYGANYLAQQGKTHEEILKTYFPGTELTQYKNK